MIVKLWKEAASNSYSGDSLTNRYVVRLWRNPEFDIEKKSRVVQFRETRISELEKRKSFLEELRNKLNNWRKIVSSLRQRNSQDSLTNLEPLKADSINQILNEVNDPFFQNFYELIAATFYAKLAVSDSNRALECAMKIATTVKVEEKNLELLYDVATYFEKSGKPMEAMRLFEKIDRSGRGDFRDVKTKLRGISCEAR